MAAGVAATATSIAYSNAACPPLLPRPQDSDGKTSPVLVNDVASEKLSVTKPGHGTVNDMMMAKLCECDSKMRLIVVWNRCIPLVPRLNR